MKNFSFHNPTKIIFGKNTVKKIGDELKSFNIKKVLLLYGRSSIFKNGVYDKLAESLKANKIEFVELGGVKPNPVLSKVHEAIDLSRKENVDAILGVGGGSVIDSAKAIAAGHLYDNDIWDAFEGKVSLDKSLPIFAVLTLSATASEMNSFAVITKEDEKKKWPFSAGNSSYPKVSIIDPTVQYSLPRDQTVNGAVDAISHICEQYFDGTNNTDLQDELAEGMIRNIMKHAKILLEESDNYNSRSELAWTASLALNGLISTGRCGGDWATHNLEHSVSAFFDIAHGAGLAILTPAWMKHVYKNDVNKFSKFAERIFGIKEESSEIAAMKGIEKLKAFFKEIGAPTSFSEVGVPADMLEKLAANASINTPLGKLKPIYEEDALEIYKLAYE